MKNVVWGWTMLLNCVTKIHQVILEGFERREEKKEGR